MTNTVGLASLLTSAMPDTVTVELVAEHQVLVPRYSKWWQGWPQRIRDAFWLEDDWDDSDDPFYDDWPEDDDEED